MGHFSIRTYLLKEKRKRIPGAIIRETVSLGICAHPWYGTLVSNFRTNCAIPKSYNRANSRACRGGWALAWILSRFVIKWWELRDSLADFSQRWQGIRQRRRTGALLFTFMLWVNGNGVSLWVDNFFNFALWMNNICSRLLHAKTLFFFL